MIGNVQRNGVISEGIKTPIIQPGDDLVKIVVESVAKANGGNFKDNDIIAVTEAVVAISQGNFVNLNSISNDVETKFAGAKQIAIVDPIQSRNRFMSVLEAIAQTKTLEKIIIVMTYPTDEVGNRLISDLAIMQSNVNPYSDILTVQEFYSKLGVPKHPFTGKNYVDEYQKACKGKAEIIFCNDFTKLREATGCDDFIIASIHRREQTRKYLEMSGAKRILDLSQIMDKPIEGSGYNSEFGLYGSNLMANNRLKLMPRDCGIFVYKVQEKIRETYGKKVEVMVFGDGAFKDPVGGIWELADPQTTIAATCGLNGTPKEVKLKYIASANEGKTSEELEAIIASESEKRKQTDDITGHASLGTTPRRLTDLLASLCDLTTGSGDRQTPVVYVRNYL